MPIEWGCVENSWYGIYLLIIDFLRKQRLAINKMFLSLQQWLSVNFNKNVSWLCIDLSILTAMTSRTDESGHTDHGRVCTHKDVQLHNKKMYGCTVESTRGDSRAAKWRSQKRKKELHEFLAQHLLCANYLTYYQRHDTLILSTCKHYHMAGH